MIVKLTNYGGVMYIEADQVFQQPLANGRIDLEIVKQNCPPQRHVLGDVDDNDPERGSIWARAYIMEHGKTVDTIRAYRQPFGGVTATCNGEPVEVKVGISDP